MVKYTIINLTLFPIEWAQERPCRSIPSYWTRASNTVSAFWTDFICDLVHRLQRHSEIWQTNWHRFRGAGNSPIVPQNNTKMKTVRNQILTEAIILIVFFKTNKIVKLKEEYRFYYYSYSSLIDYWKEDINSTCNFKIARKMTDRF